jgi:hypothetical protein
MYEHGDHNVRKKRAARSSERNRLHGRNSDAACAEDKERTDPILKKRPVPIVPPRAEPCQNGGTESGGRRTDHYQVSAMHPSLGTPSQDVVSVEDMLPRLCSVFCFVLVGLCLRDLADSLFAAMRRSKASDRRLEFLHAGGQTNVSVGLGNKRLCHLPARSPTAAR